MSTANLRFSTDILRRLGEELVTTFDQAVVELVKNAYDADAQRCIVTLVDVDQSGGTVVVADNGDGMTEEDVRDGWLVVGRSRKSPRTRTPGDRLPAGSKGLGRLAALRMGQEVIVTTKSKIPSENPLRVYIRWSDFDNTAVVEDVDLPIVSLTQSVPNGTTVEIRGIERAVTEREIRRLARELLLLTDPFGDPAGFTAELAAPMFKDYETRVRTSYFDDSEYRLMAALDANGRASVQVFDRFDNLRWSSGEFETTYEAPAATFELWMFLLQGSVFAGRATTVGEIREWLQTVGGVHLYHRGLRVRPYGDPGHDWLDMNLQRVRDPELRPSTNTSIGRVTVLDQDETLIQRTDRSGFVENEAFRELRRFAVDSLEWVHQQRLQEREIQKRQQKPRTRDRVEQATSRVARELEKLPAEPRTELRSAVQELEEARKVERALLQEEVGLYQTLASVGTAVSVFAHEIEGPATDLTASAKAVERRARRALGDEYEPRLGPQVAAVLRGAERVSRFATLPLGLLRRSKRRVTILDANSAIRDTFALFEPYLAEAQVATKFELTEGEAWTRASVAAIEAIVSNLITNAVKAFKREDASLEDRRLLVRSHCSEGLLTISVLDSGPGLPASLGERIWLPGVSGDENGTGLGLTIVKDTVSELGGTVRAIPRGELGGAELVIELRLAAHS